MMTLLDITIPIMPERYHYCDDEDSDRNWIMFRMGAIPKNEQANVAHEYTRLYLSGKDGRKTANTYLSKTVKKYVGDLNGEQKEALQRMQNLLDCK